MHNKPTWTLADNRPPRRHGLPKSWSAATATEHMMTRLTAVRLDYISCCGNACYAFRNSITSSAGKKGDLEHSVNTVGTDDIAPSLHGEKVIVSKKSSHGVGTGVLVMTVSSPFHYSCVPTHGRRGLALCSAALTVQLLQPRVLCRWALDLRLPRVCCARQRFHSRVRHLLRCLPA